MKITLFHREDLLAPHLSRPEKDNIHIWMLSSDAVQDLDKDIAKLSPAEQKRAQAYTHQKDRCQYLVGHAALRHLLEIYLHLPAQTLVFDTEEHGKSVLSPNSPGLNSSQTPIHFNVSHSGDYITLAFACSPIGIDIERPRSSIKILKLVKRYFHPDEFSFFSGLETNAQTQLFYRYWTIREAFLKGLGTGLTISPQSFYVQPEDTFSFRITKSSKDYSCWKIQAVQAPEGYVCSVAYTES